MQETDTLRVFISYSRQDAAFADQLTEGLALHGIEILIDRSGIGHGENWRQRIGELLVRCDTMVFIISPDSLAPEICEWEIAEAHRLAKRILPVLFKPVDFSKAPAELSLINAVPFQGLNAVSGTPKLITALKTDLTWLRAHTRLGERAMEWMVKSKPDELLLRGSALQEAQALVSSRPGSAPEITNEQSAYLAASTDLEARLLSDERLRAEELERAKNAAEKERDMARKARDEAEAARAAKAAADAKSISRTRAGLMAVSVVALVAVGLGAWAEVNRQKAIAAEESARQALAVAEKRAGRLRLAMLEALTKPTAIQTAIDYIITQEIGSQNLYNARYTKPIWPGGASGVTIGIGYDLGYQSSEQFEAVWSGLLPDKSMQKLKTAIGVRGRAARNILAQLNDVVVPYEVAQQVFLETSLTKFYAMTTRAFPGASELPFACQAALLSVVFNRGASLRGDSRREMREIRAAIMADKPALIPGQIRSMKRIWIARGLNGLLRRRDGEALICEKAIELRKKMIQIMSASGASVE